MNRVYDKLVKEASSTDPHAFRVILVNALTLIRNNYDISYKETQAKAQKDMSTLITYLSIYLRKTTADERRVSIIVYYPDYTHVPEALLRMPSAQLDRILNHYKSEIKGVKQGLDEFFSNEVLRVFSLKAGDKRTYPHLAIKTLLMAEIEKEKRGHPTIPYRMGEPIHLLSHVALDWHLGGLFKNVKLIESFTGEIIDSNHFGSKLLKKKGIRIPFTSVIHQTFGDDTLIKPLAVRNTKKTLLDSSEKWSMMTTDRINQIISSTLKIPISTLKRYSFV